MIRERDTSVAAAEAQLGAIRRLAGSERVALAFQMSDEVRSVAADGLRHRHPGASSAELENALRRLMLGAELADRVDGSR